jgi:hypothetical protein
MPIRVPPLPTAPLDPGRSGAAQEILTPQPSTIYGTPLPERQLALRGVAGQQPLIRWTMLDPEGRPVDLTTLAVIDPEGGTVIPTRLHLKEATSWGPAIYAADAAVEDPSAGVVSATVDTAVLGGPGVFNAEFAILSAASGGVPVFTNQFSLVVDRGLFPGHATRLGPPTLAEIRLHMRDSSPAENRLLDAASFDAAEIAACVSRCVDYFNEVPPPLVQEFTTQNFPFRYMWLEGIVAGLCELIAEWYRKNHLQYQAAGVAVDDMNKAAEYEMRADKKWASFKEMVLKKKASLNIEEGYGSLGSEYGWGRDARGYASSNW